MMDTPVNILLVDDRPDGLLTLEAVLQSPQYRLVTASSGREALNHVEKEDFAVVLLDVQMPGMDGFQTATKMKQITRAAVTPIIFVTAIHKDPYYVYQGYSSGAVDYIFKPFDPGILRSKVAVFASLFRQQKQIEHQAQELQRKEQELFQARQLESIGRLAGGVAHDFNNLITGILGLTHDTWVTLPPHDPRREDLDEVMKAANRALALTKQLLAFGRRQIASPRVLNLNAITKDMVKMLQRLIPENIELSTQLSPDLFTVKIDQGQWEQVLMNLVLNARDALANRTGKITIATENSNTSEPEALIKITDTGCGMDQKTLEHIFEPYYTTKEKDKGTGLGLATVYGVVMQAGGRIEVDSAPNKGTTFKIYLPYAKAMEQMAEKNEPAAGGVPGGQETILVVEDESIVRRVAVRMLKKQGYMVFEAQDPKEALEFSERYKKPIDLLVTDVVMPGMDGRQLAEALLAKRPTMAVLYMSGYSEDIIMHRGIIDSNIAFIEKTFTAPDLLKKVREVLDQHRAKRPLDKIAVS